MKVLIVDFDDSFTHNLAALLVEWGIEQTVISFDDLNIDNIKTISPHTLLWGPGPGHPDEYLKAQIIAQQINSDSQIYQIGICLGHQILLQSLGYPIVEATHKKHGISGKFLVPEWKEFDPSFYNKEIDVQYYSSLAVQNDHSINSDIEHVVDNGLILSSKGAKMLSFQFHPESVGTSCPEVLFFGWRKTLI